MANTLILLVLGLGLIRFSAQDLVEVLHWGPRELSCEAWLDAPLETRWVSLTGCRLDLSSAASRTYKGWLPSIDGGVSGPRTLELFLPLSATDIRETPPRVVVSTSDRELLDVVDALARVPQPEVDAFIEAHRSTLETKLKPEHLIGYVEPVASLASRSALKSMMIDRAVVLEEGRAPPKANAIFGVLVGLVMLVVALWPIVNRIREHEED